MMADKIIELLKRVEHCNIMVTGGTTRNRMMVEYLKREIPGLIIPKEAPFFEALGAALWALENDTIKTANNPGRLFTKGTGAFASLPPLQNFSEQVTFKTMDKGRISAGQECIGNRPQIGSKLFVGQAGDDHLVVDQGDIGDRDRCLRAYC